MVTVRLRYVHGFVDRTGRARFYFRHRGKRWALPGQPGTADFVARYDELLRQCLAKANATNVAFGPGTLGQVIEKYLASDEFARKAASTKTVYRKLLDQMKGIAGRGLIVDLRERHIRDIRKRFAAKSVADKAVMLLRVLWVFAKEELAMDLERNPGEEIRRLHRVVKSHKPWPDELVGRFEAEAEPKPSAQLALALLLCTGQRVSDVAKMRWTDLDGKEISVRQQKTGAELWIPCHSALLEALACTERKSDFILTGGFGKPYANAHGLSKMISTALSRMGVKGYSAHGLRHRAGKLLAQAGCTTLQIMAILGHRTLKEAERYTRGAEQRDLARQAIAKMEVANSRTKGKQASG
jgi:enterobacteria phage integrase